MTDELNGAGVPKPSNGTWRQEGSERAATESPEGARRAAFARHRAHIFLYTPLTPPLALV
jgi:hypothetical protein